MAHPLNSIIDMVLKRAEKNGEFDNLPGAGKPIENLATPKDAVINRLMTEHKAKPAAVVLKQQIAEAQVKLKETSDPDARKAQMRALSELQMRLAMELEAFRRFG